MPPGQVRQLLVDAQRPAAAGVADLIHKPRKVGDRFGDELVTGWER
jgi:hypothetical protein